MSSKNPEVVLASSITWSKCRWCHWWHLWLLTLLSSPLVFLSGSWRCPLMSADSYPLKSKFGRKECLFFGISLQTQKFPWLGSLVDFGCRESMTMMMIGGTYSCRELMLLRVRRCSDWLAWVTCSPPGARNGTSLSPYSPNVGEVQFPKENHHPGRIKGVSDRPG